MDCKDIIYKMLTDAVVEFNEHSRLVALNEYRHDEEIYQWNRGMVFAYEQVVKKLSLMLGRKVAYEIRRYTYFKGEPEEVSIEYPAIYFTV